MKRRWKITLSVIALSTFVLFADHQLHKTACATVSDEEALAILQPAFEQMKCRSRPEDVAALKFVTIIHCNSNYPPDNPNHAVGLGLANAQSGQSAAALHPFIDCGIENWGSVSSPSVGGTQGPGWLMSAPLNIPAEPGLPHTTTLRTLVKCDS